MYGVHTSLSHERKISHSEIHSEGKVVFRNGAFLKPYSQYKNEPNFFIFPFNDASTYSFDRQGMSFSELYRFFAIYIILFLVPAYSLE